MLRLNLLVITVFILIFTFCTKKNDEIKPKSKLEMITSKKWKYKSSSTTPGQIDSDGNLATDNFLLNPCLRDNTVKYSLDKAVIIDTGDISCGGDNTKLLVGTWVFNSDESSTFETYSSVTTEFKIETLTENNFVQTWTSIDSSVTPKKIYIYKDEFISE